MLVIGHIEVVRVFSEWNYGLMCVGEWARLGTVCF